MFGSKRLRIFRNLWCVRTDKGEGGVEPARIFFGEVGQFFTILCGRLLWMAPKIVSRDVVHIVQLSTIGLCPNDFHFQRISMIFIQSQRPTSVINSNFSSQQ